VQKGTKPTNDRIQIRLQPNGVLGPSNDQEEILNERAELNNELQQVRALITAKKNELQEGGKQLGPGAVPDEAEQVVGGGTVGPPEVPDDPEPKTSTGDNEDAEQTAAAELPNAAPPSEATAPPPSEASAAAEADSAGSLLHAERHRESQVRRVVHHSHHVHHVHHLRHHRTLSPG